MTYIIIVLLLLASAIFSGLNLGFMSLGPHELKRKMKLGDARAAKIYEVRKKGNLLLVTLLLGNVAVNSALAVFMASFTVGVVAGVVSTGLITIFGEILPQAFFSRFALTFGSRLVWLIKIVIWVLYPICWPISAALDKALGDELPTIYSRKELLHILEEHREDDMSDLQKDEERIASGALTFGKKLVESVMVPRSGVVSIDSGQILGPKQIKMLVKRGYTRYPVMDEKTEEICGILYMQNLVLVGQNNPKVSEIMKRDLHYVRANDNLDSALNSFLKQRNHLAIVLDEHDKFVGILSLEDVLEEIIGLEIVDEFDEFEDARAAAING